MRCSKPKRRVGDYMLNLWTHDVQPGSGGLGLFLLHGDLR